MGVQEFVFPPYLSPGTSGGPGHATLIREADSGMEVRLSAWRSNRSALTFDVAKDVQDEDDVAELLNIHTCTRGGGCGFRFKDPTDWSTNPNGVQKPNVFDPTHRSALRVVDPVAGTWQLQKEYTDTSASKIARRITRPIKPGDPDYVMAIFANGVPVYLNGVAAEGIEVSVSYDTGLVYLPGFSVGLNMTAAFTFHVPAHFGQPTDEQLEVHWAASGGFRVPVVIDEIIGDTGAGHEEHLYGGGQDFAITQNPQPIFLYNGTYQRLIGSFGEFYTVKMPDESTLPESLPRGGPVFLLENGTSRNVFVTSWFGSLIGFMTPGGYAEMWSIQFGTTKDWEMR